MQHTKNAYEILGLRENSSKDEIIKRYDILLKKYRVNKSSEENNQESDIKLEEIYEAYNQLMGYDASDIQKKELEAESNRLFNRLLKRIGADDKKISHFIYYYKYHMIIVIISLLVAANLIESVVTKVEPDLSILFVGEFYINKQVDDFKLKTIQALPELKELYVDIVTLSDNNKDIQPAMQMKAFTLISEGDIDVLIVDKANFEVYAKRGVFANLDNLAKELEVDITKYQNYVLQPEGEAAEHLYGFDVSSNNLIKDISGKEKIAVIRVNTKHYDTAVKLLKLLLK